MKTPKQIMEILNSIRDVRLCDNEIEVQFNDSMNPDDWEPDREFNPGSFTEQLLLLIEASLKGEL